MAVDPLGRFRPAIRSSLRATGIVFSVEGRTILDRIDLELAPGEVLGVLGPNGSGKSTLLRCIIGHYRPQAGSVLLDGQPIARMSALAIARKVAMVVQESGEVLGLVVGDIVALGLLPHGEAPDAQAPLVALALRQVGLDGWQHRRFDTLSGGEKRRVMLARALVQRPSLLILDEPTNHLDVKHQFAALELMRDLATSVIVTLHDLELAARYCDRLVIMQAGRVTAVGPPATVLTAQTIGAVYDVEAELGRDPRTARPTIRLFPRPQTIA